MNQRSATAGCNLLFPCSSFLILWNLLCLGSELLSGAMLSLVPATQSLIGILYHVHCGIHGPQPGTVVEREGGAECGKLISEQEDERGAGWGGRGTGYFQPGNQLAGVPAWKKD